MKSLKIFLMLCAVVLLTGCYGSQVQCTVRIGILTWDSRPMSEVLADGATNVAGRAGGGIGSNSRVTTDNLQAMVLYKSPVTATSNSTPISVELPIK